MIKRAVKTLLLVSLPALILSLVAGEAALRFWWGDQPTNGGGAPNRVWEKKYVELNAIGTRGRLPEYDKPQGTFRIVALGDSVTYGKGVEIEDDRYPELTAETLSRKLALNVESINLGVQAFNTVDELDMLERHGLKFHPDIVLLGYSNNDPESAVQRLKVTGKSRGSATVQTLTRIFYLADFIYRFKTKSSNIDSFRKYLHMINDPAAPNMPAFKKALESIKNRCDENDADFVVLIFPTLYGLDEEPYEFQDANDMITSELDRLGVSYANLLPLLKGKDAMSLWASRHDAHPDEAVHETAARELTPIIEPLIEKRMVGAE